MVTKRLESHSSLAKVQKPSFKIIPKRIWTSWTIWHCHTVGNPLVLSIQVGKHHLSSYKRITGIVCFCRMCFSFYLKVVGTSMSNFVLPIPGKDCMALRNSDLNLMMWAPENTHCNKESMLLLCYSKVMVFAEGKNRSNSSCVAETPQGACDFISTFILKFCFWT